MPDILVALRRTGWAVFIVVQGHAFLYQSETAPLPIPCHVLTREAVSSAWPQS